MRRNAPISIDDSSAVVAFSHVLIRLRATQKDGVQDSCASRQDFSVVEMRSEMGRRGACPKCEVRLLTSDLIP